MGQLLLRSPSAFPQSPAQCSNKMFASSSTGMEASRDSIPSSQELREIPSCTCGEQWGHHWWGHINSNMIFQFDCSQQKQVNPRPKSFMLTMQWKTYWTAFVLLIRQHFTFTHITQLISMGKSLQQNWAEKSIYCPKLKCHSRNIFTQIPRIWGLAVMARQWTGVQKNFTQLK